MSLEASLRQVLDALAPRLPEVLVPDRSLAAMGPMTARLPLSLTRFFGFERRIDEPAGDADLLLCVSPYGRERAILADRCDGLRLPAAFWREPAWRHIRLFARQWAEPESALHPRVLNMWLELDTGGRELPLPSVFFGVVPESGTARPGRESGWIGEVAVPALTGQSMPAAARRLLDACVDRLPGRAWLFQVGLMLGRPDAGLRLCVRDMSAAEVPSYLRDLGWQGSVSEVRDLLEAVSPAVEAVDLDLDVGSELGPKVGLELPLRGWKRAQPEGDFARLLEILGRLGLCHGDAGEALRRFWFFAHEHQLPSAWPPALRQASAFLAGRFVSTLACGVHHVKVVCRPHAPPQAKAYLAVRHLWLRPATAPAPAQAGG
jgi:hypothetical protein